MNLVVNNTVNLLELVVIEGDKLELLLNNPPILTLELNTNGTGSGGGGDVNSVVLNIIAGETINGDSLVMVKDNAAYKNDPSDEGNAYFCVGFAINAAIAGENVMITEIGKHTSAGWGLFPNSVYYAGVNGGITTTPPITGISQVVGIPKDSDTMIVEINEPVLM